MLYKNENSDGWTLTDAAKELTYTTERYAIITANDIEDIVVTALEGGIDYWACLDNITELWELKPKNMPVSKYAAHLLMSDKELVFYDTEDSEETWTLTMEKLLRGLDMNAENRPGESDLDDLDAESADCIFQYALMQEIVYG